MKNRLLHIILFVLIILLAFAFRFYKVTEIPPSLNWDEVSIAYNAYSILLTGRDEWGQFLPVHFKAFGEYKLPVQIYFSIPGIAVLGLNELGVRITPVVYGILTVLLMFFLARELFQNTVIGLLSAFLLAVSPWHIQLTRASFESSFAVFWIVLGVWFFVKGFKDSKWWIISIIPLVVSMYTYNSARIFTPLFLLFLLFIFRKQFFQSKKILLLAGLVFVLLIIPMFPYYLSGEGNSRYKLVSVTDDPGLIPRIEERRNNSQLPPPLPQIIHNRVTYVGFYTLEHYLAHFTPDFLFISGAPHKQHHVQGIGELYIFQAPFLILGIYLLFKKRSKFAWLLIGWMLLAYIPVSVTNDSIPHALRTLIAAPTYQFISAFGFYEAINYIKNHKKQLLIYVWAFMALLVLISVISYVQNLYIRYPKLYSRDWQYGYKQVVDFLSKNYQQYDEVVFTRHYGEPHIFTLFFLKYDPAKYQDDPNLVRFETHDWVRVLRFDKFYFPDLGDEGTKFEDIILQNPGKKILFIGKPGDFPPNMRRLYTVDFLNGQRAFEIVEKVNND